MCGIAGYIGGKNNGITDIFRKSLLHRGPDNQNKWEKDNTLLFHARLKIIDISDAANQPMISHCGRYVMVYNGEVYNFKEIKDELLKLWPDFVFRSASDSEVILEAFAQWGVEMVGRLNGMFAFVIYDTVENKLFLCRDRLGEKPLFCYLKDGIFAFASELKALTGLPAACGNFSRTALYHYLNLGYIPEPYTIWENISRFPKASYGTFQNGKLSITKYWDPTPFACAERRTMNDVTEKEFETLLEDSVKKRLISDVPIGLLLSGGTDSSLVSALAQRGLSSKLKTFNIGFKDKDKDESAWAEKVAKHIGTEHYSLVFGEKDALELIPEIISCYDEPYADSSALPTMLVSKLARHHVTVALTGDGGDEQFLGYGAHRWAERFANPLFFSTRFPLAFFLGMGGPRHKRIAGMLRYYKKDNLYSHIFSQEQYMFSDAEINIITTDPAFPGTDIFSSYKQNRLRPAEKQALYDMLYYLPDDLLVKTDRASMHYSLELRAPLLDHRLVEFSLSLPYEAKYNNGTAKYLLKKILSRHIPAEWVYRKKQGFAVPLARWLKNELKPVVLDSLSEEKIRKYGLFRPGEIQRVIDRFFNGGYDHYYVRIWQLLVLQMFLEKYRH